MKALFSGTFALTTFMLKRDRVRLIAWILGITLFMLGCVPLFANMFSTQAELIVMREMMENPAMVSMVGPIYGDNMGTMYAAMMLVIMGIVFAVFNISFTLRHTRQDEEAGRLEVLQSLPVGRLAVTAASALAVVVLNLILALLIGCFMAVFGVAGITVSGSLLMGAALGAVGLCFAAVAAVFAQLSSNGRTAAGATYLFLMGSYILRAIGDVSLEALSLFSPLGLLSRTQVYAGNYLWPVFVILGFAALGFLVSLWLNQKRDLGQGIVPARAGKTHGGALLRSPFGFALRLSRGSILLWAGILFTFGAMYGAVLDEMERFIAESDMLQQMFAMMGDGGASFTEQFVGLIMMVIAVIATIPVLSLMLRMRSEEKASFMELIYGQSVSRRSVMGAYLVIAFAASVFFQFLAAFGLWVAAAQVLPEAPAFGHYMGMALAYLPAIWFMLGLLALLIGRLPKRAGLVYGYLGLSFLLVYLGGFTEVLAQLQLITPFAHVGAEGQGAVAYVLLSLVAALFALIGMRAYTKRDIHG